jgi:hypothetical protein
VPILAPHAASIKRISAMKSSTHDWHFEGSSSSDLGVARQSSTEYGEFLVFFRRDRIERRY